MRCIVPKTWIEQLKNEQVKKWAFNQLLEGKVIFASDRKDYGCVVAEIQLTDQDLLRFDIPKAVNIIVYHKNKSKAIDSWGKYSIDDVKFDLESVD
jgi:hypothetical protein